MINCYCGSPHSFDSCCEPYIKGIKNPETAELLMRSRYTAYACAAADYLVETTHRSTREFHTKASILEWAQSNQWVKLEVLNATEFTVEFKAFYLDTAMKMNMHHEFSTFIKENGKWFYVDGSFPE